ncbi:MULTISPECIES: hypothetical protein [unclassified Streptomyces]|uniref:hypothetical protein n=1 Tax=unclassified Streptomyces TaxID=2593676 RepID=UPI0006B01198|nr:MULTISPECIES: hypothetical protein [unclassified Streptomyces]KOX21993.1 hypothetical protein ADL06_24570 [Streptomyces sp. NRRL F-6491]KOX41674.1 hypothetical protein ADL08_18005 [Streptomyces sp. NRRL F-6492]
MDRCRCRCRYRFRRVRRLAAPPDTVHAVPERAEDHPGRWPRAREGFPRDATSGTARLRSVLPYDLVVTVRARLLRVLTVPGGPLFRAHHAPMARGGRRGLAAHLRSV